jgi:NADPH:quinone reductase-like Zn-dependent oxidoreductase
VEASGGGLLGWRVKGRRVAVLNSGGGNWSEHVVIPARQAVPIPEEVPDDQAATFFVNPTSAYVMTRCVLKIPAGAWLLQTAANGALGRIVIRLGKRHGFRTINVVRRRDQVAQLQGLGADAVICSTDESIHERVQQITAGTGAPFALDAVGGVVGTEAVRSLANGGRMLVYGTLSGEPIQLSPRVLMLGNKSVAGFWLSEWVRGQGILTMLRLFRQVGRLFREGIASTEIAASYPLDQIRDAVRHAAATGRNGKVLLALGTRNAAG